MPSPSPNIINDHASFYGSLERKRQRIITPLIHCFILFSLLFADTHPMRAFYASFYYTVYICTTTTKEGTTTYTIMMVNSFRGKWNEKKLLLCVRHMKNTFCFSSNKVKCLCMSGTLLFLFFEYSFLTLPTNTEFYLISSSFSFLFFSIAIETCTLDTQWILIANAVEESSMVRPPLHTRFDVDECVRLSATISESNTIRCAIP